MPLSVQVWNQNTMIFHLHFADTNKFTLLIPMSVSWTVILSGMGVNICRRIIQFTPKGTQVRCLKNVARGEKEEKKKVILMKLYASSMVTVAKVFLQAVPQWYSGSCAQPSAIIRRQCVVVSAQSLAATHFPGFSWSPLTSPVHSWWLCTHDLHCLSDFTTTWLLFMAVSPRVILLTFFTNLLSFYVCFIFKCTGTENIIGSVYHCYHYWAKLKGC